MSEKLKRIPTSTHPITIRRTLHRAGAKARIATRKSQISDCSTTGDQCKRRVNKEYGKEISPITIRRTLHRAGYKARNDWVTTGAQCKRRVSICQVQVAAEVNKEYDKEMYSITIRRTQLNTV